jgi:hypothetical protein
MIACAPASTSRLAWNEIDNGEEVKNAVADYAYTLKGRLPDGFGSLGIKLTCSEMGSPVSPP